MQLRTVCFLGLLSVLPLNNFPLKTLQVGPPHPRLPLLPPRRRRRRALVPFRVRGGVRRREEGRRRVRVRRRRGPSGPAGGGRPGHVVLVRPSALRKHGVAGRRGLFLLKIVAPLIISHSIN